MTTLTEAGHECNQCHSVNDGANTYCDRCGNQMKPDTAQECDCGKRNGADAKFCNRCGTPLT